MKKTWNEFYVDPEHHTLTDRLNELESKGWIVFQVLVHKYHVSILAYKD